ncbi:nuclear transport factor 2 family protein [Dyella mobilis]|uniref:Nuclear transport factor 2 family protein n=1 Tax=Dyella mobilis TaxID=1849582 RepID=A0ABS2KCK4_9GAMM|nr:nuclear transport factor 2 family protein [Dyella mobilis]MBM7128911.1 nuclear transport factor 2 family protein [Dyella mobilis]GLQ99399.1 hypothetical protein GCM10007863_38190 [Dyella mobilis]
MKYLASLVCTTLMLVAASANALAASNAGAAPTPAQDALFNQVSKLDTDLFDSFNHCASPEQLQKHAGYFVPNVEFYHDNGGATWSRQDYLQNTKDHVCGQFRRVLVPGSLQVFPIKDFGAIEQGSQKFCWIASGKCFGEGQFLILWHNQDNHWVATRVFSYDHHSIE